MLALPYLSPNKGKGLVVKIIYFAVDSADHKNNSTFNTEATIITVVFVILMTY